MENFDIIDNLDSDSVRDERFWNIILENGNTVNSMLNDAHMSEFMKLVPHLNMQETVYIQSLFRIRKNVENNEFVQILFSGPLNSGHWICVWFNGQVLRVYDSLNNFHLHEDHKKYLYCLFANHTNISVSYEKVQKQRCTYNCGLFAIAYAISIHYGVCPCSIEFEEEYMRQHLIKIFQDNEINMFPLRCNKIPTVLRTDSYHSIIENDFPYYHYAASTINILDLSAYYEFLDMSILNYERNSNNVIDYVDLEKVQLTEKSCHIKMKGHHSESLKKLYKSKRDLERLINSTIGKKNKTKKSLKKVTYFRNNKKIINDYLYEKQNIVRYDRNFDINGMEIMESYVEGHLVDEFKKNMSVSEKLREKEYAQMEIDLYFIENQFLDTRNSIDNAFCDDPQYLNEKIDVYEFRNVGLICNKYFDENDINSNYLGNLNVPCEFCNALHFKCEENRNNIFRSCCHSGKVMLSEDMPYPRKLMELMVNNSEESQQYRNNIREYNNSFAFASFGVKFDRLKTVGPHVFRICGQVYHNIYALHCENKKESKFGQLYIIDNELANTIRCTNKNGSELSKNTIKELDKLLKKINPYAWAYAMMHEVEKKEKQRCKKINEEIPSIKKSLTRNACDIMSKCNEVKTCNEVAAVFVTNENNFCLENSICVYSKSEGPISISTFSEHVDPMTYLLMMPHRDLGWTYKINSLNLKHKKAISVLQFYSYKLQIRGNFNPHINLKKLSQQFIVDGYTKVEKSRLDFCKQNQAKLRTDLYKGYMDYVASKDFNDNEFKIGKRVILPSSFNADPRSIKERLMDALTLLQNFGKPDIFLIMTCSPKWKEITENLLHYDNAIDRPELVARVFHEKVNILQYELKKNKIFGTIIANLSVIEFQKRGLPHIHTLIYLSEESKIRTSDQVNDIVTAEIPDVNKYPKLYELVKQYMVHGPCNEQNPNSPCMENGVCTKHFPKQFIEETRGGKIIIVSGDFSQTLPIVRYGDRKETVEACVKYSQLWKKFKKLQLYENMRLKDNNEKFKNWLLDIGEGKRKNKIEKENNVVGIPDKLLSTENIVDKIFGKNIQSEEEYFFNKVILAPRNDDVLKINAEILSRITNDSATYYSVDYIDNTENENFEDNITVEFLNSLNPNGLPLHKLDIKIGCIVMLLRNLNIKEGLCNGTRLIILSMRKYTLQAPSYYRM